MHSTKGGEHMEEKTTGKKGKQPNQRMQHFLVLQYLLEQTDENNFVSATSISKYLKDAFEIDCERRSIYKDIDELNLAYVMVQRKVTRQEAVQLLKNHPELETVQYIKNKGYHVVRRPIAIQHARLLAECVYTARFVTDKQSERLVKGLTSFLSEHQREEIEHDAFAVARVRTDNKGLFHNIDMIHAAIATKKEGSWHDPEKISFKYLKCTIQNPTQKAERRRGSEYVVSPHAILINEGNYYLLGIDDKSKRLRTYRIDRMKEVKLTGAIRERNDDTYNLQEYLESYPYRVFSMYGGKREMVRIRFTNDLLDTVVDRFGNYATYLQSDSRHFTISVVVEISPMFFGWLCGFGNKAKLISPSPVIEEFNKHLAKMQELYQ